MAGMRSLQSLDINLGMFGFSTKVYKAINDPTSGIEFRQIHDACQQPINYVKRCHTCSTDVEQSNILKGYEVAPGNFLTFTDAEIKALRPEKLGVVAVDGYLPPDDVDSAYHDGTVYYLAPDGKDFTTFVTFREALQGRWAVGKVVMYGRERVCAIRAVEKMLVMHLLRTHAEIRDVADVPKYDKVPETANPQFVDMMGQLMTAKTLRFDDVVLEADSYVESVKQLIQARLEGQPMPEQPVAAAAPGGLDLMAALQASLAAAAK